MRTNQSQNNPKWKINCNQLQLVAKVKEEEEEEMAAADKVQSSGHFQWPFRDFFPEQLNERNGNKRLV